MHIEIDTIPHSEHRIPLQVGDWFDLVRLTETLPKKILKIRVTDVPDENHSFLVGLHELIEAWLCRKRGIKASEVDLYDEEHAKLHPDEESGDNVNAPYHKEHQFATKMEKMMAEELGVNWEDYESQLSEVLNVRCP